MFEEGFDFSNFPVNPLVFFLIDVLVDILNDLSRVNIGSVGIR